MTHTTPAYKVGDRVQLTTDITVMFTHRKKGEHGTVRKTAPWGGLLMLRMTDGRTVFARPCEITRVLATTGAEFARDHGNDSSTWTAADFDSLTVLADIDLQPARRRLNHTTTRNDHAPAA